MAQFLIRNIDNISGDSVRDASSFKRGDIVMVKGDAHLWGGSERLPGFIIVKVPGLDESLVQERLSNFGSGELLRQRRYYLSAADMDDVVSAGGEVTLNLVQLGQKIRDKNNG